MTTMLGLGVVGYFWYRLLTAKQRPSTARSHPRDMQYRKHRRPVRREDVRFVIPRTGRFGLQRHDVVMKTGETVITYPNADGSNPVMAVRG